MRFIRPSSARLTPWGRITAVSTIGIMLTVVWLAADPLAHAKLHAHEAPHAHDHTSSGCTHHDSRHSDSPAPGQSSEDTCIIAVFAEGHLGQSFSPVNVTDARIEFVAHVFPSALLHDGSSGIRQPPSRAPPGT